MKDKGKSKARIFDINSALGLILAVFLMVFGIILTSTTVDNVKTYYVNVKQLESFWDPPSVVIVVGGIIACLMISFPISQFAKIPKHLMVLFTPRKYNPEFYIEQLILFEKDLKIAYYLK